MRSTPAPSRGHVLVVDDEPMVREVLSRYLALDGYTVDQAGDGEEALDRAAAAPPDLVVLDLMLPRIDGYEVLERLRQGASPPVIMLTARGEQADRIVGLELGADDYVTKPFSPREVVARVHAVLRRVGAGVDAGVGPDEEPLFDDLVLDRARRLVRRGDADVGLTRKEYELIAYLVEHTGETVSRSRLLEDVWDFAWEGDSATVTVHVRRLREKLERDPSIPVHLVTVWGVGYRFEP
jgi:DNA-binding response OmpR family regulator